MRVFAFVGPSGTGKSHRALFVARQHQIQYMIDDGLLIHLNKRIAGRSAKREHTYIAAVKRAIFHHPDHREEVRLALGVHRPEAILIIGTSDEMVAKIAKRLDLPPIERTVYIEEISSKGEIALARNMRQQHGKHVIPLPAVEVKGDFSGYFLDKLRVFGLRRGTGLDIAEKSVVRPTFSYLGRYTISQKAMQQIIQGVAKNQDVVKDLSKIKFTEVPQGLIVDLEIIVAIGYKLQPTVGAFMRTVKDQLEGMTGQNVIAVNVYLRAAKEIKK